MDFIEEMDNALNSKRLRFCIDVVKEIGKPPTLIMSVIIDGIVVQESEVTTLNFVDLDDGK